MAEVADVFPGTIEETLSDGSKVQFPRLDLDDLGDWTDKLHLAWKERQRPLIPPNIPPIDRYQIERQIEFAAPTLDDIADLCYKPKGIKECLRRSLRKSGANTDEEAFAIIKRVRPNKAQSLAQKVSSLFNPIPLPTPKVEELVGASGDKAGQPTPPDPTTTGLEKTGSVPPLVTKEGGTANTGG